MQFKQSSDAQIVGALYDGVVTADSFELAFSALAKDFDCHSASIVSFDPILPRASAAFGVGVFNSEAQRRYDAEFAGIDPAPAAFAARPSGTGFASNRLFDANYLRGSVFLHEFLRPLGIEETLGGTVASDDGRLAFLTLHRDGGRPAFDDDDIARIELLLPHVARALQLRRAFARLETNAALLAGMIDRLPAGVLMATADNSTVHVNRAALAIAARGDGLWLDRKGLLHAKDQAAERSIGRHINAVLAGQAGGVVRAPRNGARPYGVLVAPLPSGSAFGDEPGGAGRGVLILIHDPDAQLAGTEEAIAAVFGLPMGTARLIAALVRGEELKDYAARHSLSYETIRYHLKSAYARTGARSQARLLQLVTRALTEFGDGG